MSERAQNEQLLRAGIEAFNRGDDSDVLSLFTDDVECHVASGLGNPGTWHGIDGYREMVTSWGEAFSEQRNEVVSVEFPDDHHIVAEIRNEAVGAGSGVPVEMSIFYMLEVRDGVARRFHIYANRESALAATREPGSPGEGAGRPSR